MQQVVHSKCDSNAILNLSNFFSNFQKILSENWQQSERSQCIVDLNFFCLFYILSTARACVFHFFNIVYIFRMTSDRSYHDSYSIYSQIVAVIRIICIAEDGDVEKRNRKPDINKKKLWTKMRKKKNRNQKKREMKTKPNQTTD